MILSALFVNLMHTLSWNRAKPQLPSLLPGFFKLAVKFPHPNVPLTHCNPLKKGICSQYLIFLQEPNARQQEPSNRLLTTGIFIIILCVTETLLFFLLDNFVFSYFWRTSFCNRFLNYLLRALKVFKSLKNLDCEQSLNFSSFESQLIAHARG